MQEFSSELKDNITDIDSGELPATIAISDKIQDFADRKVVFSFESYNQNKCELAKIALKEAKRLIYEFKKISKTFVKHFRYQETSGIACKLVRNSGDYSVFYHDLPKDVEILEIDYTRSGRIFGFMVQNIFNIVAITKKHL